MNYHIIHVSDPHITVSDFKGDPFYLRIIKEVNSIAKPETIFINTGDIFDQWSEMHKEPLSKVLGTFLLKSAKGKCLPAKLS